MDESQRGNAFALVRWLRRLYRWVLSWADHPAGVIALVGIAFLEASVFPIPPDVLLIAMALGRPRRSFFFAFMCTLGSVVGGVLGYGIGLGAWHLVQDFFFRFMVSEASFSYVAKLYSQNAFWAVFTAGFTPIPYKVFTISAGVFSIPFSVFLLASTLGRAGRFFLVAALIFWFGGRIRGWIDKYFEWATGLFAVALIGGFFAVRYFF